jgi:hypothetical protein
MKMTRSAVLPSIVFALAAGAWAQTRPALDPPAVAARNATEMESDG